jgi:hypothetical protein
MTSGAQTRGGRFLEVGWGFHDVLIGSRVFWLPRRMTLEKIPRDVASWCWLYLAAKPSYVEVDVAGLAFPLHLPTACSYQMRGHGFLSGTVLSHRAAVGGGALLGDVKPSSFDVGGGVDYLGTCVIEFYMKRIIFTRICLPYVGVIMVHMRVSLVELPFQTVMGQIPTLLCMLSNVHGLLQPRPISSGNECYRPSRP